MNGAFEMRPEFSSYSIIPKNVKILNIQKYRDVFKYGACLCFKAECLAVE